ncbi:MAG: aminoglycoside 6-adenylyltransferase [Anaerolineae bacterium]|nr:aminoglycoside 6-adenylyltransferase [Anaerolineae bacterium]
MRTEQEMLDLILGTAREDERIRAVILNGSRANPNAPRDPFQDFDIVYVVTDVEPFWHNLMWIERFGELMILQLPDEMHDPPPAPGEDDTFCYLMQFVDGNRIDLGIWPAARAGEIKRDSLSVLLLDKDGIVEPFDPPSERDYLPRPPTAKAFADCCNEFWWVSPYVAKGLWRQEIIYARHVLDHFVRDQLMKMVNWYVGVETNFACNPGKFGKHLECYLGPELWQMLQDTYADAGYEHTWGALFAMCHLFRRLALHVAGHFGFEYPHDDDARVSAHLRHVKRLPRDAQEMY